MRGGDGGGDAEGLWVVWRTGRLATSKLCPFPSQLINNQRNAKQQHRNLNKFNRLRTNSSHSSYQQAITHTGKKKSKVARSKTVEGFRRLCWLECCQKVSRPAAAGVLGDAESTPPVSLCRSFVRLCGVGRCLLGFGYLCAHNDREYGISCANQN